MSPSPGMQRSMEIHIFAEETCSACDTNLLSTLGQIYFARQDVTIAVKQEFIRVKSFTAIVVKALQELNENVMTIIVNNCFMNTIRIFIHFLISLTITN